MIRPLRILRAGELLPLASVSVDEKLAFSWSLLPVIRKNV